MLKRLLIVVAILAGLAAPVQAAGTIPGISMSQQLDSLGRPLNGGKLYLIQAGTTSTPQNCYQDSGLTLAWPNPITLDSAGRVPQLFCADGSIKIRLTNSAGVQQLVADGLLVVGPSGGGGGGSSVDATTILTTGDFKMVYGTGPLTGFVRCNGRTIGSASSGASERANADTQSLFEYFWGVDTNLSVSGGRGASANADWVANKTLTLPDCRGRGLFGLADMGNSASPIFGTATFTSGNGTTLGATLGAAQQTMARSALPNVSPTFTGTPGTATSNNSNIPANASNTTGVQQNSSGLVIVPLQGSILANLQSSFTPAGTVQSLNGGVTQTPLDVISPAILTTVYIKL